MTHESRKDKFTNTTRNINAGCVTVNVSQQTYP